MLDHASEGEFGWDTLVEAVADRAHRMLDRAPGVEAADHAGRLRGLNGDNLRRRPHRFQPKRRTGGEAAWAGRRKYIIGAWKTAADFQADRPGAGDDVGAFAVIDEAQAMLIRIDASNHLGVIQIVAADMKRTPKAHNRGLLGFRASLGKEDVGAAAQELRGIGHGLAMIAGGCRAGAGLGRIGKKMVESAAKLEGRKGGGDFALYPHFGFQKFAQRGRPPQRCLGNIGADALFRGENVRGHRTRRRLHLANCRAFISTAVTRARRSGLLITGFSGGSGESQAPVRRSTVFSISAAASGFVARRLG